MGTPTLTVILTLNTSPNHNPNLLTLTITLKLQKHTYIWWRTTYWQCNQLLTLLRHHHHRLTTSTAAVSMFITRLHYSMGLLAIHSLLISLLCCSLCMYIITICIHRTAWFSLHYYMMLLESCLKPDHNVDCQPFMCQLRHPCSGE